MLGECASDLSVTWVWLFTGTPLWRKEYLEALGAHINAPGHETKTASIETLYRRNEYPIALGAHIDELVGHPRICAHRVTASVRRAPQSFSCKCLRLHRYSNGGYPLRHCLEGDASPFNAKGDGVGIPHSDCCHSVCRSLAGCATQTSQGVEGITATSMLLSYAPHKLRRCRLSC